MTQEPKWHRHADFVSMYELYLNLTYRPSGRGRFARDLAMELRRRGVTDVLDCAAGTGFPSLDLATPDLGAFLVHCCDADPLMLAVLCQQAEELGLPLDALAPPRSGEVGTGALERLVLGWAELERIPAQYDLVMCRGNSLVYADTWSDDREDVAPPEVIGQYLNQMARRVRPGGYLLIDAPRDLEDESTDWSQPFQGWAHREEVTTEKVRREWRVYFRRERDDRPLAFRRYSSKLTIGRTVEVLRRHLGLDDIETLHLEGDRPDHATIIARKPE